MRYRWVLILVVLFLIISLAGCDQRKKNAIAEQNENYKFEIYLVKENEEVNGDLSKIKLEDKPVITEEDIITYYWDKHILKMKKGIIEERLGVVSTAGKRFVLKVNDERIYLGSFWTYLSSCLPPETPIIYKEGMLEEHDIKEKVNQNEQLYCIVFQQNANDPRGDNRIYNTLREIGILNE